MRVPRHVPGGLGPASRFKHFLQQPATFDSRSIGNRKGLPLSLGGEEVQQGVSRNKPAVQTAQTPHEPLELRLHTVLFHETLRKMRVHDRGSPLRGEPILVLLAQHIRKRGDAGSFRPGKPGLHEGTVGVMVRHHRAGLQRVDFRKCKVSHIANFFTAEIAPEERAVFDMSFEFIWRLAGMQEVIDPPMRTGQAVAPPIDTFSAAGVIGHAMRVMAEQRLKPLQAIVCFLTRGGMIRGIVQGDFESLALQVEDPRSIRGILAGDTSDSRTTRSPKRPDRHGGPEPQFRQQGIDRFDTPAALMIGVIENGKRKGLAVWPLNPAMHTFHCPVRVGTIDYEQVGQLWRAWDGEHDTPSAVPRSEANAASLCAMDRAASPLV